MSLQQGTVALEEVCWAEGGSRAWRQTPSALALSGASLSTSKFRSRHHSAGGGPQRCCRSCRCAPPALSPTTLPPLAPFPAQTDPLTLSAWILTQQHKSAGARGRLTVLLNAIGVGCKFVSSAVRRVRRPRGWGLVLFGEGALHVRSFVSCAAVIVNYAGHGMLTALDVRHRMPAAAPPGHARLNARMAALLCVCLCRRAWQG